MTVFVDKSIYRYGRMVMCHMMADTKDELFDMALKIGVDTKWFQGNATLPHFDICASKRKLAVKYGAVESDTKKMISRMRARLRHRSTDWYKFASGWGSDKLEKRNDIRI